jgi:WhiB family redox-sensing transcriptional regulator
MNLDDFVTALRTALRGEIEHYDPGPGRARLEAAVATEHISAPQTDPTSPPSSPVSALQWVDDWPSQAACRTSDPAEMFDQVAAQNRAKKVCAGCPVRTECLAEALDNRVEFGVWGGMTERERRALLRRRPTVISWRRLLEQARADYEASLPHDTADTLMHDHV